MPRFVSFAAVFALLPAGIAKADFIVTYSRLAGTGMFAGDDVIRWAVENTGTGTTAGTHKLLALDVTMSSPEPGVVFFIRTFDSTAGTEPVPEGTDADLANLGGENPSGSYVRAGSPSGFTIVSTSPDYLGPDSGATPHNPTPYTDGQSLKSFQVVGSPNLTNGGVDASNPILFAQSVVPQGHQVMLSGFLGAETGDPQPFTAITQPEPVNLGLVSLALVLILNRRRSRLGVG